MSQLNENEITISVSPVAPSSHRVSITRGGKLPTLVEHSTSKVDDLKLEVVDELLMKVFYLRNAFSCDMRTLKNYQLIEKIDLKVSDLKRVMKKDLTPDTYLATILHGMDEARKSLHDSLYLEPLLRTYIKKSVIRVMPRKSVLDSEDWPHLDIVTTIIGRPIASTVLFISHKWFESGFDENQKLFKAVQVALKSSECKWVWVDKFCADQSDPASDLIIVSKLLPHMTQFIFDAGAPELYQSSAWCALEHLSFGLYPEDSSTSLVLTTDRLKNPMGPPLTDRFMIFDERDWVKIYLAYLSLGDSIDIQVRCHYFSDDVRFNIFTSNMITGLTYAASVSHSAFVRGTAWGLTICGNLQPRPNPVDVYSSVSCEKGHSLKTGVVPSGVYTCDGCRRRINDQKPVGMCRICNFDLCSGCVYGS
jgi:hypothetical protein